MGVVGIFLQNLFLLKSAFSKTVPVIFLKRI